MLTIVIQKKSKCQNKIIMQKHVVEDKISI